MLVWLASCWHGATAVSGTTFALNGTLFQCSSDRASPTGRRLGITLTPQATGLHLSKSLPTMSPFIIDFKSHNIFFNSFLPLFLSWSDVRIVHFRNGSSHYGLFASFYLTWRRSLGWEDKRCTDNSALAGHWTLNENLDCKQAEHLETSWANSSSLTCRSSRGSELNKWAGGMHLAIFFFLSF